MSRTFTTLRSLRVGASVLLAVLLTATAAGCSGGKKKYFFSGSSQAGAPIVQAGFVPVGAPVETQGTGGTLKLSFSTALLPTGRTSANIVVLFQGAGSSTVAKITPVSVDNVNDTVTVNVGGAGDYQPEVEIFADQAHSSGLASSSGIVADGTTPVTVTVFAKDADGLPVGGDTVTFAVTGSPAGITITQPGTTDATGAATGSLVSTLAGTFTVTATITGHGGPTITVTALVTFVPGPLDPSASTVASGFGATLANGFATIPITVTTTDKFKNPIAGLTVTIAATGSFMTINQPSAPTDATGKTSGSVASSFPQGSTVTATVQSSSSQQLNGTASISFVLVPHYLVVAEQNSFSSATPLPAEFAPNSVAVYKVNPTSGAVTLKGTPTPTDPTPSGVAVEPRQRYVYVGCNGGVDPQSGLNTGSISAFQINDADGSLKSVPGSPFHLPHPDPANSPYPLAPRLNQLAITPNGQFLYCADPTTLGRGVTAGVYGFSIDSTGALHYIQRAIPLFGQVGAGAGTPGVQSLAVDPSGRFLYVSTASQGSATEGVLNAPRITRFSIDPRLGLLTEVGTFVSTGFALAAQGYCAMDPLGRFLYGSDPNAGDVYLFGIEPVSGDLKELDEKLSVNQGDNTPPNPVRPVPEPFARRVYVPGFNTGLGQLSAFSLGFQTGGNLVPLAPFVNTVSNGISSTLAVAGGLVYQTDGSSSLSLFTVDATGAATAETGLDRNLSAPAGLAVTYGTSALP